MARFSDEPSDKELFEDAISGLDQVTNVEPPRQRQQREPVEDDVEEERQPTREPRDERGRFAPQPKGDEVEEDDDQQQDDDQDDRQPKGRVPSYRLREANQRAAQAEQNMARMERMFETMGVTLRSLEDERKRSRPPEPQRQRPDVWVDPEGFRADIDQRVDSVRQSADEIAQDKMINLTFRQQHRSRGEEFEQAYSALRQLVQRGSPLAREITNDADPGEALMSWYDREKQRAEIGNDLPGYIDRTVKDRLKKDPEYRKTLARELGFEILDDGRDSREPARGNGRSGQSTLIRVPSVNSLGGGGGRRNSSVPVTDRDLFEDAVGGLPTVRARNSSRGR